MKPGQVVGGRGRVGRWLIVWGEDGAFVDQAQSVVLLEFLGPSKIVFPSAKGRAPVVWKVLTGDGRVGYVRQVYLEELPVCPETSESR